MIEVYVLTALATAFGLDVSWQSAAIVLAGYFLVFQLVMPALGSIARTALWALVRACWNAIARTWRRPGRREV